MLEADLDIPEDLDPTVEMLVDQLSQQVSNLSTPYPREALGVGARWTVTTSLTVFGIDTQIVYEYELRELDGDRLVIDAAYEQTAEPQKVDLPGVPSGTDVRISSFAINGSGTITADLTSLVPITSMISASGDQVFTIEDRGEEQELSQTVTLDVTAERIE